MNNEVYVYGISILILASLLPQAGAAYLCFRWMKFPRRRWMRVLLLIFGHSLSVVLIFRFITVLWFYDILTLMLISATSSVAMHFITTAVLWLCTLVFEKRFRAIERESPQSATNILGKVIDDLVVEGHKKGYI